MPGLNGAYTAYSEVQTMADEINSILGKESQYTKVGMGVTKRILKAVANYSSPIDAYYYAETTLNRNSLNKPFVEKYKKFYDDNYAAYTQFGEIISNALEEKIKPEEAFAQLEAYKGEEGVNSVFVDYYKFALAYELGQDEKTQLEFLRDLEASAEASGEDYGWLYYQPLALALYDSGEYEQAIVYLDKIISRNTSDYAASDLKMRAQVSLGDTEAAGKTVEKFKSVYENSEVQYYSDLIQVEYLRATGKYDEAKVLCVEAINREEIPQTNAMVNLIFFLIKNHFLMSRLLILKKQVNRTAGLKHIGIKVLRRNIMQTSLLPALTE